MGKVVKRRQHAGRERQCGWGAAREKSNAEASTSASGSVGFKVGGLRVGVYGSGLGVFTLRVQGFTVRVQGFKVRVQGFTGRV